MPSWSSFGMESFSLETASSKHGAILSLPSISPLSSSCHNAHSLLPQTVRHPCETVLGPLRKAPSWASSPPHSKDGGF